MTPDELDRLLAREDTLEPSSGFAARVMARVREPDAEQEMYPKFPWVRFVGGFATAGLLAGLGAVQMADSSLFRMTGRFSDLAPEIAVAVTALLVAGGVAALPKLLFRP